MIESQYEVGDTDSSKQNFFMGIQTHTHTHKNFKTHALITS